MKHIYTNYAPTSGAYSQGVLVDPLTHKILFLAGQTGNDPSHEGDPVVDGGVGPQTTQTLKNILAIVESAGGNASSLFSIEVFLKDSNTSTYRKKSREEFEAAYCAFFEKNGITKEKKNMPARVQVWVAEVPWEFPTEDTRIEIRAVAAIPR